MKFGAFDMAKLGRNEPCWCGSGEKYKKCHLNREAEASPEMWEIDKGFRQAYGKKYCSCPEEMKPGCKGNIINSHTVSKGASLKAIEENKHVYGLKPSIFKFDENNGVLHPELIGINKASTFTGFCSKHDKELFSPFEDFPFEHSDEQVFLLTYRTFAREHFVKLSQSESRSLLNKGDAGLSPMEQVLFQGFLTERNKSLDLGVRDSIEHKNRFDQILNERRYDEICYTIFKYDSLIPIQCSGVLYPLVDAKGTELQSLADDTRVLDMLCVSIINDIEHSYIVFSWLKDSAKSCQCFIDALLLLEKEERTTEIISFLFYSFENIYLQPSWWDGLSGDALEMLSNFQQPLASYTPLTSKQRKVRLIEGEISEVIGK
ncbi:cytoplasmic protein [Vibrio cholerae]|nr:cytoplasmic protein [Vibrio cholerae]EGR4299620.1 cytoplasmic protein [Vibrio cholerae]